MTYIPLPESILKWVKITKDYIDFATAGLTNTISIYTPADNETIHAVILNNSAAFTGGLIATYTISVGYGAAHTMLLLDASVFTVPVNASVSNFSPLYILQSSADVNATAISTVGNLNAATNGSVDIYLLVGQLPE